MSKELEAKVWASALDATLKPVAAFLADIANADGTSIYPSVAYIAWGTGSHECGEPAPNERTVQRHVDKLLTLGVLTFEGWRRGDARIGSTNSREKGAGKGATAEYTMHPEALPQRRPWRDRYDTVKGDKMSPQGERVTPEGPNGDTAYGDTAYGDTGVTQTVILDPSRDPPEAPDRDHVAPSSARRSRHRENEARSARSDPRAEPVGNIEQFGVLIVRNRMDDLLREAEYDIADNFVVFGGPARLAELSEFQRRRLQRFARMTGFNGIRLPTAVSA